MIDPKPTASHFINGAYVEDTAGSVINVVYPATGEVIARVHGATPAILEAALAAAKAAQPAWAALTGTERGRILRRASDIMREQNRPLYLKLMTLVSLCRKPWWLMPLPRLML